MKIEIDSFNPSTYQDFSDVCHRLIEQGKKFDQTSLQLIPYYQLHLCCIGNAGPAACSLQLVQQEKTNRRERFLYMEPEEFKEAETFLKIEQMYDDVLHTIATCTAPQWEDLNACQKLWAKLTCLYNHVDNPSHRLDEILALFAQCAADPIGGLPVDVCRVYSAKLKGMASVYPGKVTNEVFREKVGEIAETLLEFMPSEERQMLEKEQFQNFSCTSDCFRILV